MSAKTALIMAGGTGGHIFPGLAVAEELRARGWRVHWLGAPNSMESRLVPPKGFPLETVDFSGVRGKGLRTLLSLPLRLLRALGQTAVPKGGVVEIALVQEDPGDVIEAVQPFAVAPLQGGVAEPGQLVEIGGLRPLFDGGRQRARRPLRAGGP